MSDPECFDVGYRKPPKNTQFTKGRSGNPNGRPKGSLNMATVLERTLREKVVVKENGRRKTINKLQAAVTQLANKAVSGDLRALQLLSALIRYAEERAVKPDTSNAIPEEVDERIVLGILERMGASPEVRSDEDENINE